MITLDLSCRVKLVALDWVGPLLLCGAEVGRIPPLIPGVYLLHAYDEGRGYYRPLYAGKAHELRRRLGQHLAGGTARELRVIRSLVQLYFSAAPVLDPGALDRLEAGLIRLLMPPFNRQVPAAPPLYANLPPVLFGRRDL